MPVRVQCFRRLTVAIAVAVAPLWACAPAASQVTVEQPLGAGVSPRAVYAWGPEPAAADPRVGADVQQKVRIAIDSALAAKGYRQVGDPAAAQVLVTYRLGVQEQVRSQVELGGGAPSHCGPRGCGEGPVDVHQDQFTEGTLTLEITDRASGRLAWRGVSQKPVLYESGGGSQTRLNAVATELTKSLPGG